MSENIIHLPGKIHINQIEDAEVVLGTSSLTESELDEIWNNAFPTGVTITFSISSITYTALPNMTWTDWVGSVYNTDGFYIESGKQSYVRNSSRAAVAIGQKPVLPTAEIIAGQSYVLIKV